MANAMKKGMKRVGGKRTPDLERIANQPPPTKEQIDQWTKEVGCRNCGSRTSSIVCVVTEEVKS